MKAPNYKAEAHKQEVLEKIAKQRTEIENGCLPVIDKLFDCVVIDPPWSYGEVGGFEGETISSEYNRGGVDYPTMTLQQIRDIKVPAKDDSLLFLWTTHKFLHESFHLLEHWGFDYKATITWDKARMGVGRNIRLQCEFCLLGKRGNIKIRGEKITDIIVAKRREHSRKPNEFYVLVDQIVEGSKLDYFSRERRHNWESYGNDRKWSTSKQLFI